MNSLRMTFEQRLDEYISRAIEEDKGEGDHTSLATIPQDKQATAYLLAKENGVLAGVEVADKIFRRVNSSLDIRWSAKDGQMIQKGEEILEVKGDARDVLLAERLVLNTMQRMSGIATQTHQIVSQLKGLKTKVLDTRKTTPNMRFLEKLAVKIGGGENHRFGLFDMILIKDNHIDTAGGIANALQATQQYLVKLNRKIPVEIEVRNFDELQEALEIGGMDRILLDNFTPEDLARAVKVINGRVQTEASGNIVPENVALYAQSGVDYVSMGCLTHSVKSLDLSLKIKIVN